LLRSAIAATCISLAATAASAQVTPATGYTPPDDTPAVRVGVTIFGNWTQQNNPKVTDGDGNSVTKNSFDIARSYINVTGNISHIVGFRITPDVSRETNTASSLAGSLEFRIKYAYLQANLDDWMPRGSYAKFGIQQTPYIDYTESVYRYRFQGTTFTERVGYFASADSGVSFYYSLPKNYGAIHAGVFNGENYTKAETNDQKAVMIRGTVRPFATGAPVLRGLRLTGFYDSDHYNKEDERKRTIGQVTFEHNYLVAGLEAIRAKDQVTSASPDVKSGGWALWATPKKPMANGSSVELLLRYDHWIPNEADTAAPTSTATTSATLLSDQRQNRTIAGVAYWFPHTGGPTSAILLDYDGQKFDNISTAANRSVALHFLVNY